MLSRKDNISIHDKLGRLTAENIPGYGNLAYTYDKTGNRTTLTEPKPTGGPTLALSQIRIYWASYTDWQNHQLSVDYRITDNGPGTALETKVTGATATNGVYPTTNMPLALGNINQGSYVPFTLKYYIPSGVTSFQTTVYSTCKNAASSEFYFPENRSFYTYNQANQLTQSREADGATTSYAYNAGGSLTQKITGADITTYAYDGLERLTGVQTPTASVNYGYDALGRRISRTEGAKSANYHHLGQTDLTDYETDATGSLTASYDRGPAGLISNTDYTGQSPVTSYNLYNPHGDTAAITDQTGAVTASYRYDAFGNALSANDLTYAYTGKWQREGDAVTGTIRMGVREYDPMLGRFTGKDALHGSMFSSQSLNRYSYGYNNPKVFTDLNGLMPEVDFEYYEVDKTEQWWNDTAQEGLEDSNPVTGFCKWAGGKTAAGVLDLFGPEAAQDAGRAWGDPNASNLDRFTSTAELAAVVSGLAGAEAYGAKAVGWMGGKLAARFPGAAAKCTSVAKGAANQLRKAKSWGRGGDYQAGRIAGYTKHGLTHAISRDGVGVSPKAILDAVKNPVSIVNQSGGKTMYIGKDATVILNSERKVVTT